MKLYKISQDVNTDYDTYDSAIVCAENEEEAKRISPDGFYEIGENDKWFFVFADGKRREEDRDDWCDIKDVRVEYIGEAKEGQAKGVILASFSAG